MVLALLVTVLLLLFALATMWRCWNLPPVPAMRLWAVAWSGMSAWMLYFFWRAEAWKKEAEKLELKLQEQRTLRRPQALSTTSFLDASSRNSQMLLDADVHFVLPGRALQFLTSANQFEPDIAVRISALARCCQKF